MSFSPFATLQQIGKSLMVPVTVLPAAGLLVAVGRMLQKIESSPLVLKTIADICYSGGLAVFENLAVIFAIGVAIGFAEGAGIAGLAAAVAYYTMINTIKVVGTATASAMVVNTGVFGGIIIGLISALLYRRFYQTQLPQVLGFFSGKRLVPIIAAGVALIVGALLGLLWPPVQQLINDFGTFVMASPWGPAFYAAGKRLLIPVGLHHVYYPPFLYQFGEFITATGEIVHGETARYFAGDPTAGKFMASEFPIMLFGLPAAALAITLRAKSHARKAVAGVMLSAALTSIITGITEPIEFAFIFVAPILYVLHVGLAFVSGYLTSIFDIHLGYTFSASLIDFGLGYFNQKNGLLLFGVVGPIIGIAYFTLFYSLIGWLKILTPGREEQEENGGTDEASGPSVAKKGDFDIARIVHALGGSANFKSIDACITRLRLSLKDESLVNDAELKKVGAAGIMRAGGGNVQVVFGVRSEEIKDQIKRQLASAPKGIECFAPMNGLLLNLSETPDETFAQKILGDGVAILPADGVVIAPFDGTVAQIFPTGHAVGLQSADGTLELLIHVGIDTVNMQGQGFKALVKNGERVTKGQRLIEFDLELVKARAKSPITPIVVTNGVTLSDGLLKSQIGTAIRQGDLLFRTTPQK